MEPVKCCVPGCCGSKKLIKFPDPKSQLIRFKCWLSFINVRTTEADDYNKLYQEYKDKHMCDMHFNPVMCKVQNDAAVTVYTVPVLYGPKFWSENCKKIVDALKVAKGKTIVLKENNSIFVIKDQQGRAAKRMKLTDSPETTSNSSPTTPDKQVTRPRILRKQNIPAMPVVRLERMNLETSPVKPKSDAGQEKEPDTSEGNTRRKRPTSGQPSRVSDTPSPTGSRKSTESEAEVKSESEDGTDSDKDYEVEKIDSDSDDTECEMNTGDDNNMHQEIEYLDMDQLELDEIEQAEATTNNFTRTVYVTNESSTTNQPTVINKTLSSLDSRLNTANSVSKTNQNCTQNNTQNSTIPDVAQNVTIPQYTIFEEYKRPNLFKENERQNAVQEIFLIDDDDEVSKPNTDFKTYSRTHEKKPTQMIKLLPTAAKQTRAIQINNGAIKENLNKTNQEFNTQQTDKNKLTYVPVLEIDGKSGKLIIQLTEQKQITEKSSTPTNPTPKEQSIQEPIQSQDTSQSEVTEKITPTNTSFSTTSSDSSELRSLLTKHNITPIDPETTKGSVIAPRTIKKSEVGIPKEILNQAKLLAANSFQNSMDPTKKTNVYVLDSNGSILLKEQLAPQTLASTAAVPKNTPNTAFQQNSAIQGRINQFTLDSESKKISELNQRTVNASLQINQLQKEAKELRNKLKQASKSNRKLKNSEYRLKSKVKQLSNLESHPKFQKVIESLPRIARTITSLQFRSGIMCKSKRGRRFTEEEKELAFSLRQECPTVFKYMKRMGFVLPSTKKSKNFQNVESAIDRDDAIEKLKTKVKKMPPQFRICVLLFDEKLISPSNRNKHVVTAVGSEGEETEVTFEADHALIFMVVGIVTRYEEPVSYTFSFGPTHGSDLALQIKGVISDLQAVGYKVLATICDHAENNRTAIGILTKETETECNLTGETYKDKTFKVNDEEIVALYDPPHLLKGIRNNLISKNLKFHTNKFGPKTAKWEHVEMLLKENPEYRGVRLIPKLTESHVYPTKLGITKVRFASQVFSRSVAVYMGYLAEKDILPQESRDTAELLLFFDSLFDSFNGYPSNPQKHLKPLLSAAKPKSKHHVIWKEALNVFNSMEFVNNGTAVITSDIECWKWTIEGYKLLLEKIFTEHQIDSVWMRVLNQDALERLFRTEVNPSPTVRAKNMMKQTTRGAPTWFAGEVVTQKVIKAIKRLNREEKNENSENSSRQKKEDSKNFAEQKKVYSENSSRQKKEDSKNFAEQKKVYSENSSRQKKEDSKNFAEQKKVYSENSAGQKKDDSENSIWQENTEDSENSASQINEDSKDSCRQEENEDNEAITEVQFLHTQDMPLL